MSSSDKQLENVSAGSLQLLSPLVTECSGTEIILEENPLMCAVCLKTFKRREGIKRHIIRKKHILHEPNKAIPENLGITLPKNWKYGDYKLITNDSSFTFLIYDIRSKEDVVMWLKLYMEKNKSKFVAVSSRSLKTGKELRYQCEHWRDANRKHKLKVKGTGCKCAIICSLSRDMAKVKISHFLHNHSLTSAAITWFHKPTEKVKQIFLEMFNNGAGPSQALNQYKNHVRNQNLSDVEYLEFCADKSKMPKYRWVHQIYQTQLEGKYGSTRSDKVMEELKVYIDHVNAETCDPICKYKEIDGCNFVAAIMTPLMKRICDTQCAGELLFMDSTGSVDRFGLRVFLLMSKLNCGRVPVGVIITTKETEEAIAKGLALFLEFVTASSFGGRGTQGPRNIITDNSASEIAALNYTFPNSACWLCIFHVLQYVYKWLWKRENQITNVQRSDLYRQFKKMLYAESEDKMETTYNYIIENYKTNPRLLKYMTDLYSRRKKWCLCFRSGSLLRGSNTNNIAEKGMRVLKEDILNRTKAQTPVQLVAFLIDDYTQFYMDKIMCFILQTDPVKEISSVENFHFIPNEEENNLFTVISQKGTKYIVNIEIGMCSCYIGCSGAYCKHQRFINSRIGTLNNPLNIQLSADQKNKLYYIATGNTAVITNFFEPLQSSTTTPPTVTVAAEVVPHFELIDSTPMHDEDKDITKKQVEKQTEIIRLHCQKIKEIMLRDPAMYISALSKFSKTLEEMCNVPSRILPTLHFVGRTSGFFYETDRC